MFFGPVGDLFFFFSDFFTGLDLIPDLDFGLEIIGVSACPNAVAELARTDGVTIAGDKDFSHKWDLKRCRRCLRAGLVKRLQWEQEAG